MCLCQVCSWSGLLSFVDRAGCLSLPGSSLYKHGLLSSGLMWDATAEDRSKMEVLSETTGC